jgi:hypothetical protein
MIDARVRVHADRNTAVSSRFPMASSYVRQVRQHGYDAPRKPRTLKPLSAAPEARRGGMESFDMNPADVR